MRTLVMDSQILDAFQECPVKYDLSFNQNLRSAHVIDPIVKGDILHTALEEYYRNLKNELGGEQSRDSIHKHGIELAIVGARAKAALNGIDLGLAEEVITTIEEYFHFYRDDDLVPLYIEEPFIKCFYESPEQDIRILYAGKIDLVATASRYQWNHTPFDHKTTSRNTTPSGRHNQFFGYADATNSNLVIVNRVGFQKTLTPAEKFKRLTLSYPKEYREAWKLNTIKWGLKLVQTVESGEYEENITSCDKFSGCTFKPICESVTPEAREWKIQSDYIVGEKWDVSKILELKNDDKNEIIDKTRSGIELLNSHATD